MLQVANWCCLEYRAKVGIDVCDQKLVDADAEIHKIEQEMNITSYSVLMANWLYIKSLETETI